MKRRLARILLLFIAPLLVAPLGTSSVASQKTTKPWLVGTHAEGRLSEIHTIRADADVTVSDGQQFSTTVVYHDPQRAVFHRVYEDREVSDGVDGQYFWRYDQGKEMEGPPFIRDVVLGHQVHALILFYDRLNPNYAPPEPAIYGGSECMRVTFTDSDTERSLYYDPDSRPLGMRVIHGAETTVTMEYDEWREVDGISLPFLVRIDDGQRQFDYRYTEIRFNDDSIARYRAPESVLTDEQLLLRRHRLGMDMHFWGRTEGMREVLADSVHIVGRGEIHPLSGDQTYEQLEQILEWNQYTVYDDLVRPIVRVSEDGTLGWVIVQIAAEGTRRSGDDERSQPFEFVSAWVELYEKVDGTWRMTGNVSNFRPQS